MPVFLTLELAHRSKRSRNDRTFEQVTGIEIKYKFEDRRQGDVGICIADPSKAMEYLNWKSKITTESINNGWNFLKIIVSNYESY